MKRGQPVKVKKVWAGSPLGPLTYWFSGYSFETIEELNDCVLVKSTRGVFTGEISRHRIEDVKNEN